MEDIKRTVLAEYHKTEDITVRLSHAMLGDVEWLDIRDFVISSQTYQRGVTMPWSHVEGHAGKAKTAKPVEPAYGHPIHCVRCGGMIGFAERKLPIRAQCTDPVCAATQSASRFEDRDSVIELLSAIGLSSKEISKRFGLTPQGVANILT